MLLRSVTKHIKEQNWFAVALDFLIVVVGILIAFQITNWSEARSDTRSLDTALKLLRDEIKTNIMTLDTTEKQHLEIATAGKELLQITREPNLDTIPMILIGKVFVDGYSTDYSFSALNYVLNQAPFQSTQNSELRQSISQLPARYEDTLQDERITIRLLDERWVPYISQYVPVESFWNDVHKDNGLEEFLVSTDQLAHFDKSSIREFKKLASSLEFQNMIVNRLGYEALVLSEKRILRDALETALELIEKELD